MANKADRASRSTSLSSDAEDPFLRISVAVVALALAAIPLVYWTLPHLRVQHSQGHRLPPGRRCSLSARLRMAGRRPEDVPNRTPTHPDPCAPRVALRGLPPLAVPACLAAGPPPALRGSRRYHRLRRLLLARDRLPRSAPARVGLGRIGFRRRGRRCRLAPIPGSVHFPGLAPTAGRVASTLGNPVYLGSLEAVALCLTLGLVVESRQTWQRVAAVALLAVPGGRTGGERFGGSGRRGARRRVDTARPARPGLQGSAAAAVAPHPRRIS